MQSIEPTRKRQRKSKKGGPEKTSVAHEVEPIKEEDGSDIDLKFDFDGDSDGDDDNDDLPK